MNNPKLLRQEQRKKRIRGKISGTESRPRISIIRSSKFVAAQIIDDVKGVTLVSISAKEAAQKGTKTEVARILGKQLAEKAVAKHIVSVVFDRNGYQ
jgi:large subunit ribosomal protein L18